MPDGSTEDEMLRRLGELHARLGDLDVRFESAVRRAGDELYARTEAALDEVARHIDGVVTRLDALEERTVSTTVPAERDVADSVDAEVRARLIDTPHPSGATTPDATAVQLLRDESTAVVRLRPDRRQGDGPGGDRGP